MGQNRAFLHPFKHPLTVIIINTLHVGPHKHTYSGAEATPRSLACTGTGETCDHTPSQVPGPRIHPAVTVVTEFLLCSRLSSRDFDGNPVPCVVPPIRLCDSRHAGRISLQLETVGCSENCRKEWDGNSQQRVLKGPKMRTPSEESWLLHRIGLINLFLFDNFLYSSVLPHLDIKARLEPNI